MIRGWKGIAENGQIIFRWVIQIAWARQAEMMADDLGISDCRSGSPVAGETSKRTGDVPTGYATQHTGLGVKLQRSRTATMTDISRNRPTDPSSGVRAADEGCK